MYQPPLPYSRQEKEKGKGKREEEKGKGKGKGKGKEKEKIIGRVCIHTGIDGRLRLATR